MKKVYCENCIFNGSFLDGRNWSHCRFDRKYQHENGDYKCSSYKRKWYKFWVK